MTTFVRRDFPDGAALAPAFAQWTAERLASAIATRGAALLIVDSAAYWARLDRVVFAATRTDAATAGFDDAEIYAEFSRPLHARGDYLDEFYESLRVGRLESRPAQTLGKAFRRVCLCGKLGDARIPSSLAAGTGGLRTSKVDPAKRGRECAECRTVRDYQL